MKTLGEEKQKEICRKNILSSAIILFYASLLYINIYVEVSRKEILKDLK